MSTPRTRPRKLPTKVRLTAKPAGRGAQAAIRREQLLSAALELFSKYGYSATSTRSIAEAAGVTEGLVFHYFPTKEAMLLEIAARQHTFAGRVRLLVQGAGDSTALNILQAIADGLTGVSSEELSFISFMQAEAQVNASLRSMVASATSTVVKGFVAMLAKRVETGELRAEASLTAAAHGFFGGFLFFFTQHRHLDAAGWRREATVFAHAWAEQCWRGIATSEALTEHAAKTERRPL